MTAGIREIDPVPVNIEVIGQSTIGLLSNAALIPNSGKGFNGLTERQLFGQLAAMAGIIFKSMMAISVVACHLLSIIESLKIQERTQRRPPVSDGGL